MAMVSLITILLLHAVSLIQVGSPCSSPKLDGPTWQCRSKVRGPCYRLFKSAKTWQDAENHCQEEGGHLASVHSSEELDFVIGVQQILWFWVGGTDSEGNWKWTDGTSFSFIEPKKDEEDANCLGGLRGVQEKYHWHSHRC